MELLSELIRAHGVSGNEDQVRRVIVETIEPLVDDVRIDSSGNVIAHKEGRRPNFMLAAHMDEIGLMVREIAPSGLLLCAAIGGVNPMTMIGMRVTMQGEKETIHGIVSTRFISCGDEHEDVPEIDELVVDTGLTPEKLAKLGITVGAFLEPAKETNWLTYGNTISGKALDDRLGCYALIEIARNLRRVDQEVYYVFTVQEEIGMHGAKTSAFSIHPRWAIVIDVTAASDMSEEAEKSTGTKLSLGKGPCLLHMDESFISNVEMIRAFQTVAKRLKMPIQHEVSAWGSTDASNISTVRRGVPSVTISIPIRNVHSPVEIANRKDVEATIDLVSEFLRKPPSALRRASTSITRKAVVDAIEVLHTTTAHKKHRRGKPTKPKKPARKASPRKTSGKKTTKKTTKKKSSRC